MCLLGVKAVLSEDYRMWLLNTQDIMCEDDVVQLKWGNCTDVNITDGSA